MSDYWHDALAHSHADRLSDPGFQGDFEAGAADDLETGTAMLAGSAELPEVPMRSTHSGLATIVRLQSSELERLARENERLMDRIETLLRLQEREQVLRQQMQAQIGQLGERIAEWQPNALAAPPPVADERRDDGEIKPVLLAMLDLLERMAPGATARTTPKSHAKNETNSKEISPEVPFGPAATAHNYARIPAAEAAHRPNAEIAVEFEAVVEGTAASCALETSSDVANEGLGLPDILTRPIEDLTTARRSNATPEPPPGAQSSAKPQPVHRGRPFRDTAERSGAPAMFAWTSIFS